MLGLFNPFLKYIALGTTVGMLLLMAWAFRLDQLRGHYRALYAAEKIASAQTVTNYRAASKQAQEAAQAEKSRVESEYERKAEHANQNYDSLRAQYRTLLVQRTTAPAHSGSSDKAGVPVAPAASGLPETTSGAAFISISRDDALKCADLGAYAMGAFNWVKALEVSRPAEPAPVH